jgi:hypothetical protein
LLLPLLLLLHLPLKTPLLLLLLLLLLPLGQRTEKLFEAVDRAAKQFSRRIPTAIINEVVQGKTNIYLSFVQHYSV